MRRSALSRRPRAAAVVLAGTLGLLGPAGAAWAAPAAAAADSTAAAGASSAPSPDPDTGAGAGAGSTSSAPSATRSGGSYWSVALCGGLLAPLGTMRQAHSPGLAAGVEIGWTAGNGLGAAVLAQYAPLRPAASPGGAQMTETQFGAVSLLPRFSLGKHTFRIWIGGGGGLVLDYTRTTTAGAGTHSRFTYEPAATGAAGLDLHIFTRGGLAFRGSYTQSFGSLNDRFYTVTGGLLLSF